MTILLSLDDTDNLTSRGTGRLARDIAAMIQPTYPVHAVTRHQLYVHEAIPFTSHNSCAVIHIGAEGQKAVDRIWNIAQEAICGDFIEGSDPGIASAETRHIPPAMIAFGKDAKTRVCTQEEARTLAQNAAIRLKGLGGTEDGVIGAMAGLGLALTGNDGRYLFLGRIRMLTGPQTVHALLAAGISGIFSLDGRQVTEGTIMIQDGKSAKPCPVNGNAILFVKEHNGAFHAVKRD